MLGQCKGLILYGYVVRKGERDLDDADEGNCLEVVQKEYYE